MPADNSGHLAIAVIGAGDPLTRRASLLLWNATSPSAKLPTSATSGTCARRTGKRRPGSSRT